MKSNIDKQIEINILPPESAGEKLLFRVLTKTLLVVMPDWKKSHNQN